MVPIYQHQYQQTWRMSGVEGVGLRRIEVVGSRDQICPKRAVAEDGEQPSWCPWPESNQHSLRNSILSRARLPVPPQGPSVAGQMPGAAKRAEYSGRRFRVNPRGCDCGVSRQCRGGGIRRYGLFEHDLCSGESPVTSTAAHSPPARAAADPAAVAALAIAAVAAA